MADIQLPDNSPTQVDVNVTHHEAPPVRHIDRYLIRAMWVIVALVAANVVLNAVTIFILEQR